jgi:hypothetical protein
MRFSSLRLRTPVLQNPDVKCFDEEFGPSLRNESGDVSRDRDDVAEDHTGVIRSRICSIWSPIDGAERGV